MSNVALKVEGLSKEYRIGKQERYKTFRDTLVDAATAPARRVAGLLRGNAAAAANLTETIWALKDVSFDVKHGEVVGIIGRNGAGKSTLLKILSRITEPTTGTIDVYGRVGALLEVGTGFHPELTGRENIFLNGAILGMSRTEIKRKFDEIVDFAGVEKFIDTPVKHYSSGMGLRLGFAVAAHLEPEILIVDEVLAVGDAEFQKKCMGKMSEVAGEGRTVLFVSHNLHAVQILCQQAIMLDKGKVLMHNASDIVINKYINLGNIIDSSYIILPRSTEQLSVYPASLHISNAAGIPATKFKIGEPWKITLTIEAAQAVKNVIVGIGLRTVDSIPVVSMWSAASDIRAGTYTVTFDMTFPLLANTFQFAVGLTVNEQSLYYRDSIGTVTVDEVPAEQIDVYRTRGTGIIFTQARPALIPQTAHSETQLTTLVLQGITASIPKD